MPWSTCEHILSTPLLSQIQRDMQWWGAGEITPALLEELWWRKRDDEVNAMLLIINRTVYWARPRRKPRSPIMFAVVHDLQEIADAHDIPDVELFLNVDDYPRVPHPRTQRPGTRQRAPVLPLFSFYQTRDHADIVCPAGSFREADFDRKMLRGPHYYEQAWPWPTKVDEAFWQGNPYCSRHRWGRCSRMLLPHLSQQLNASS
eukprot:CAMPEP_0119322064 /NCGR_PEP_ID=MMETSP1333-20130426/57199_1 /TAXON_ID=418940 /ORGANISM="Scyphosphaera apsteinii, Strain RCC1455" /LENGTH=202 /DNA_ID=CAMNT_0007329199 /DNA_START=207 /DNA_END=812 /DNA_ORIENTATION=-